MNMLARRIPPGAAAWALALWLAAFPAAPALAAGLDASLFLRQCQPFFERLAALDARLKAPAPDSPDAWAVRELGLIARLAGEYLIDAKNMIVVSKSVSGAPEATEDYIRKQLALTADKLALDTAMLESLIPAVSGAELATAASDLLKVVRQQRDFLLQTASEGRPAQAPGGGK